MRRTRVSPTRRTRCTEWWCTWTGAAARTAATTSPTSGCSTAAGASATTGAWRRPTRRPCSNRRLTYSSTSGMPFAGARRCERSPSRTARTGSARRRRLGTLGSRLAAPPPPRRRLLAEGHAEGRSRTAAAAGGSRATRPRGTRTTSPKRARTRTTAGRLRRGPGRRTSREGASAPGRRTSTPTRRNRRGIDDGCFPAAPGWRARNGRAAAASPNTTAPPRRTSRRAWACPASTTDLNRSCTRAPRDRRLRSNGTRG
mmetsp:Transcript_280/g.1295  ORF Transcript_280/g.1295 Transcript_280/m.1295 type:complete len:257 (+) Transcript_280:1044-1814(+)